MQFLITLLSAFALAASTTTDVTASSIAARGEAAVITPRITSPHKGDVWEVKSQQLVTWDTSEIPSSGVNDTGSIVLTFRDDGSESLPSNRWYILAEEFPLMNGEQTVIVPDMPYGTTYFLDLYGDAASRSPEFTISTN